MSLAFAARIEGDTIRCTITADRPLDAPVFCFSLMAPAACRSGGTLTASLGGYAEVTLPDLAAGTPHDVVLAYDNPGFRPVNRAWLPLGAYLRTAGGCLPLPALPGGRHPGPRPDAPLPALRLAPPPDAWHPAPGTAAAPAFACGAEPFAAVAALADRNGMEPFLAPRGLPVRLADDPAMAPEAYALTIAPDGITATAATRAGHFHAAITLLTLRETHGAHLPCGTITDSPRFGWRGQHLDCARHFFAVPTILRVLDLMALMKLNRFHWHFADDEAFRLHVTCAPEIWQKTETRGEGQLLPGLFGGGIRTGGSYSQIDVQEILSRARDLNIEVLPEIEVPAHALALNRAVRGLRDPTDTGDERSVQGYAQNIVNPALPATWALLEPLATEVAGLFPLNMLHLGCDELPPGAWEGSPAVAALKRREGLADHHDVQGWTIARLAGHIARQGIRPAAWEEAAQGAQGGIGHDALLFSWTGQGPGIAAARRGHQVVMCPAQHLYFDMAHSADPEDWGAAWAAFLPLEETVNWRVVPEGAEDIAPRIAGVQGCFWAEFTTEDRQIEPMLAPRILGLACKAWERAEATDGPRLRSLAAAYAPLFGRIGWQMA